MNAQDFIDTSPQINVNLTAEEWKEKEKSLLLPQAEDILLIKRRKRYFNTEEHKVNFHGQRRPCYFCAQLHHNAKRCPKRRACFSCKGKGHFAVDCPFSVNERDRICLKCGETGHDMLLCNIDYCPHDLEKIHCYACNELGHIFCENLFDTCHQVVSCFNCGKIGHLGSQCPKPHPDKCGSEPPFRSCRSGQVVPSNEDVEGCVDLLQIPVQVMDSHLASCEQDVIVDSTSKDSGVNPSFSSMKQSSKEQTENCCHHELNGIVETVLLPSAEDMLPAKFDDGGEEHCEEALTSMLQQQQAPNKDPLVLALVTPNAKSVIAEHTTLRRRRHFDSGNSLLEDDVVNFRAQRQCKPCYFCGQLQHNAKRCPKRRTCQLCKRKGHFAGDCPVNVRETDRICLKCGQTGHDMSSCNIEYCPDDLSKIHCFACNTPGHIFCGSSYDISSQAVSCFNCGEIGHPGSQCPKPHVDRFGSQPPPMCYKCGETGHSARQCRSGGNVSGSCEVRQGTALDLAAEGDDGHQNRKKARRQRAYKHGRLKKQKSRGPPECMTV